MWVISWNRGLESPISCSCISSPRESENRQSETSCISLVIYLQNHQVLIKSQQDWLRQWVEQFDMRSINLLFLFGIRRNCRRSGRIWLSYLSIRRVIKQIVVIIGAYHFCQLCTKFYPTSCCQSRVLVGKPEGKRPLGRPRHRWEDNIKPCFHEVGWWCMDWIDLAQERDRWRALVNTIMNLWVL